MKEWHVSHMEKTIVKYVTGLSYNASSWEKRQNKKYCRLPNICRQIDYDMKHGATKEQVLSFLKKVRHHSSFSTLRTNDNSLERLRELDTYFTPLQKIAYW